MGLFGSYINENNEIIQEGISDERSVGNFLIKEISHLLKLSHQPGKQTPSWIDTIFNSLLGLHKTYRNSMRFVYDIDYISKIYNSAIGLASNDTGIPVSDFEIPKEFNFENLYNIEYVYQYCKEHVVKDSVDNYIDRKYQTIKSKIK